MKKIFFTVISLLIIIFIAITLLKHGEPEVRLKSSDIKKTEGEKENIQRFWQIYRKATENRIAGKPEKAALEYEQALNIDNQHEDAWYYLGNVYLELNKFESAKQAWQHLVRINPNSSRAHFQLGDLYLSINHQELFDIDSAEQEFKKTLDINKEESAPTLRLGQIALIRNHLPDAKNLFEAVMKSNFKSIEAHFLDGYIAWKTGQSQKASDLLVQAAQLTAVSEPTPPVGNNHDTNVVQAPGISQRSEHQSIFKKYYNDLSGLDRSRLLQEQNERYQQLNVFLEHIRKVSEDNTTMQKKSGQIP